MFVLLTFHPQSLYNAKKKNLKLTSEELQGNLGGESAKSSLSCS